MATSKKKPAKKKAPAKKAAMKKAVPAKKSAPASKPISAKPVAWANFISPLNDRLVVSIQPAGDRTAGGIIIPGSATQQPTKGKVLAVGPGRRSKRGKLRPLDVSVGDEVFYAEHSGTKLTVMNNEVLILREEEVLGILTR